MLVLQVNKDRFTGIADSELKRASGGGAHIRRPVRGIDLKEDTFATLRVVAGSGTPINLIDAGSNRTANGQPIQVGDKRATDVYSNFLLQSVQEDRMEKQQILETFGEPYIFLFGERARVITFQGILLNTFDFNWEAEWWHNYDNYLRGTRCVENDARVFLSYDENIISGYVLASSASKNAQDRNFVNFQFQMFVTSYANFSRLGDPHALQSDYKVIDQNNPAQTAPFRPTIVARNRTLTPDGMPVENEGLKALSLAEGLAEAGLASIINIWKRAQEVVGDSLIRMGDRLGSGIVRVPVGYAGSLVFDDEPAVNVKKIDSGLIKYGVFSQNTDEYIGASSHYGSSGSSSGAYQFVLSDEQDELQQDQALVKRAQDIWEEAGYEIPDPLLATVSSKVVGLIGGMIGVGATAAWRSMANDLNGEVGGATLLTENGPLSNFAADNDPSKGRHGSTDIES